MSAIQIKRRGNEPAASSQPRIEYGSNSGNHASPANSIASSSFSFDSAMEAAELEEL
ncbi:MAG: hypothetical protein IJ587_11110 [Synergistaceae bacterium]|nr:hypothetical protein [Synergistaceae bacterium]